MISGPVTVTAEHSIGEAIRLMQRQETGYLLVMAGDELAGVVTRSDLLRALPVPTSAAEAEKARAFLAAPVSEVMTTKPVVIPPSTDVVTAARILQRHGFQALPVVDQRRLVGVVTNRGIIDAFGHDVGADIRGVEVTVDLPNTLPDLHRLVDALAALELPAGPLALTVRLSKNEHRARLRLAFPGPLHVAETLAAAGFRISQLRYEPLADESSL